ILFCFFLLATYAFGFNLLCSFNLQSSFAAYSFYHHRWTPVIVGGVLAVLVAYCLFGGGKRIVRLTEIVVPFMGIFYMIIALIIIFAHITSIPHMFVMIFKDAFDFRSIFGGISGSCMIYGIKRGLYSNEAGVGSAPNASASATVSHPVKQGLVQTVSVYIDTMLLCTATALMCLSSGVRHSAETSGAPYVQNAISTVFGGAGPVFITISLSLFAFTTLLGNLYYTHNALAYMNHYKKPSKRFMNGFYFVCVLIIFVGAIIPMDAAWAFADISMGGMTLINLPCCFILSGIAIKALKDYEKQKKAGQDPTFHASAVDIPEDEDNYWR
ncbi:MAG: alanine:cation symporter family protein, partial [Lachnospiraceae bacterium]|nr:alanine:cation symporter family protein [Lachnospiraceae bacterium]